MSIIIVYLLLYALYLLLFIKGGWIRLNQKSLKTTIEECIRLENITVVIPFRNEEKRILPLLESIKQSESLPSKIIFINDHSNDKTLKLIEQFKNPIINIISLENEIGKKRAIEKGVRSASTNFILTLDADVHFSQSYFKYLGMLPFSDLHVLPIKHGSVSFFNRFLQQDVLLADLLNGAIAGWIRPIFCSGANLLFRKDAYLEVICQTPYFEIDSGDDVFLMRELQRQVKKIEVQLDSKLAIQTELTKTLKDSINQRMRWLGKAFKIADRLANLLAQIQFVFSLLNIGFLIVCLVFLPWKIGLSLIFLKTILELLFSINYYRKNYQLSLWLTVPIYLLILPFINVIMLFAFLGFKPIWKGRLVVQ